MALSRKHLLVLLVLIILVGSGFALHQFQGQQPAAPETAANAMNRKFVQSPHYDRAIKVINHRCLVCHSCLDAPCQLKMSSWEAIDRGAHKDKVYDGHRILQDAPTRMFEDANNTEQWRKKGFTPVLASDQDDFRNSLFYRVLDLKKSNPLPPESVLPDSFDFRLNRDQQCPSNEEFNDHAEEYPLWGMPYALPALEDDEFELLVQWLAEGAPQGEQKSLSEAEQKRVAKWERFLNQPDNKTRLVARYFYEHLYLANLYFSELQVAGKAPRFFKLVRSETAPGKPVQRIATRRPFDDPGVEHVYYRLVENKSTTTAKTHMPYRLDQQRMDRWNALFFESDYKVGALPGYTPRKAANPFSTFEQLPVKARYKFMLDEAQYTIRGFIKGPVCRGQTALNVINDHFWVLFIDPDHPITEYEGRFVSEQKERLQLPAGSAESPLGPLSWLKYSRLQRKYEKSRMQAMDRVIQNEQALDLDLLWDGDGFNRNAALTIFRHFDSATVLKGHHGNIPKTAWVISYSLLERIHYLLVAGFDVYGDVDHQLLTRLYMDFLRMEGEMNFLLFLPPDVQREKFAFWYRGARKEVKEYFRLMKEVDTRTTALEFHSNDPQKEFIEMVHKKFGGMVINSDPFYRSAELKKQDPGSALHELASLKGSALRFMPEQSVLRVESADGTYQVFTLLRNLAHSNISHLFDEQDRLLPEEHTVTLLEGVAGAHPNIFFDLDEKSLAEFATMIAELEKKSDYTALLDRFAVRRTNASFWKFSDWLHQYLEGRNELEFGYLDYNRLENR